MGPTRIFLLSLLTTWAALGVYLEWSGRRDRSDGGGFFACIGLVGVGAYVIVSLLISLGEAFAGKSGRRRGFPVIPLPPSGFPVYSKTPAAPDEAVLKTAD